jgi:hypothetical protein
MTIFIGFLDDSGSDGKGSGPVFAFAGYVSSVEAWKLFSVEWQAALKDGKPIEYFKMREANSLKGEFLGWSASDRDAKVDSLASVIIQRVEFGISNAIFWEDLEQISKEFPEVPLHPYDIMFHGSMSATISYLRRNYAAGSQVGFTFDEQGKLGTRAARVYDQIQPVLTPEERRVILGRPEHKNDKLFNPLQAADMIAWQTRRFCSDNADVSPHAPIEKFDVKSPVMRRLQEIRTIYNTYGEDRLRKLAAGWRVARSLHPSQVPEWYRRDDW